MMVYVPESDAAKYRFTSALPVQLLKRCCRQSYLGFERSACAHQTTPLAAENARRAGGTTKRVSRAKRGISAARTAETSSPGAGNDTADVCDISLLCGTTVVVG